MMAAFQYDVEGNVKELKALPDISPTKMKIRATPRKKSGRGSCKGLMIVWDMFSKLHIQMVFRLAAVNIPA